MDRFIDSIEWIAAVFIGIVALDVFLTVMLRYFFGVSIPDGYDFGQLLLGILIFWGIAATSYRGTHITVDLLWANVGPRWQRHHRHVRDAGAAVRRRGADLHAVRQGRSTHDSNVSTFDLRLPVWPFFLVAWLGDVAAVLLIAVRTYRLIFHPEMMANARPVRSKRGRVRRANEHRCRRASLGSSRCSC